MEVTGTASAGSAVEFVRPDQVGFAGLSSNDFMRLLITQLQNQDPTEPVGNDALLTQLSTMRNLQANIELAESLKAITSNQQLSTASNFIGKSIRGQTGSLQEVVGVVDRAFLRGGKAYVGVGDSDLPLTNVTDVEAV